MKTAYQPYQVQAMPKAVIMGRQVVQEWTALPVTPVSFEQAVRAAGRAVQVLEETTQAVRVLDSQGRTVYYHNLKLPLAVPFAPIWIGRA